MEPIGVNISACTLSEAYTTHRFTFLRLCLVLHLSLTLSLSLGVTQATFLSAASIFFWSFFQKQGGETNVMLLQSGNVA